MDFSLSGEQQAVRAGVEKICARFPDDYWLAKDREGSFPHDFHRAFAEQGWLGIAMPQAYGGAGPRGNPTPVVMEKKAKTRPRAFRAAPPPTKNFWLQSRGVVRPAAQQK